MNGTIVDARRKFVFARFRIPRCVVTAFEQLKSAFEALGDSDIDHQRSGVLTYRGGTAPRRQSGPGFDGIWA